MPKAGGEQHGLAHSSGDISPPPLAADSAPFCSEKSTSAGNFPPIVLVHGIFNFGKGAREFFYYLKGVQVDYVEEHSKYCGHSQFGRVYERGHYPEWDVDNLIHFVGHSAGVQVV